MPGDATDSGTMVTALLAEWRAGSEGAFNRLLPVVYDELRRLARGQLRRRHATEPRTLDTTALVHEAYLKLVDQTRRDIRDRQHFLAVAATAMRHIVVDHARRRRALKRGGAEAIVAVPEADVGIGARQLDVLAVDEALTKLGAIDPRLVRLVELRVFAGVSVIEAGEALDVSERTVKRDWQKARAFLAAELAGV